MTPELASTDTTAGACAVCTSRTPRGMGTMRAGGLILGVGMVAGVLSWQLGAAAAVSGACMAAGALFGFPLIGLGLRGVLGTSLPFATGEVTVASGAVASPGRSIDVRVWIRPDHLLYVQSATLELIALERDAQGGERVLDVVSLPFAPGVRLQAPIDQPQSLRIPDGWPLTLQSPHVSGVTRHSVETRLRLAIDFAAHPLFVREVPVVISATA